MKAPVFLSGMALVAGFLLGCQPGPASHDAGDSHDGQAHADHEGHGDHEEDAAGARFEEGRGIVLLDETRQAIGFTLDEARERTLRPVIPLEAQVYRSAAEASRPGGEQTGYAYAAALLPPADADVAQEKDPASLRAGERTYSASVWKKEAREVINNSEILLEIPDAAATLHIGDFVTGSLTPEGDGKNRVTIPRPAVLETASGPFAYVERGGAFLRTPITTGQGSPDFIEVTNGIAPGDRVVTHPVETLYLIELRATKGGGHSH